MLNQLNYRDSGTLTHFKLIFYFYTPENVRKSLVF